MIAIYSRQPIIIIVLAAFLVRDFIMSKDNITKLPFVKRSEVEKEIRRIAIDSTKDVIKLDHAVDRMEQRGITDRQIFNVLRDGDRSPEICWDTHKERGWKCSFHRITAGESITVAVKLVERNSIKCLILTAY